MCTSLRYTTRPLVCGQYQTVYFIQLLLNQVSQFLQGRPDQERQQHKFTAEI